MLADLGTCKLSLNIAPADTAQDGWLAHLVVAADGTIKRYCKQVLETQVFTEFFDGTGTPDLVLRQRPVRTYSRTGTLTAASPVVTGLASTTDLLAGMPAIALAATAGYSSAVPAGTAIQSVDSGSQVTLSANAAASGSFALLFGLAVYLDNSGYGGDRVGAFDPATTQLVIGQGFTLKRDQPDGSSKSGLLRRLGAGYSGGLLGGYWPSDRARGSLTARGPVCWPEGYGNVKVVNTAGWGVGPNTVVNPTSGSVLNLPAELVNACCQIVAWMQRTLPRGASLAQEQIGRYTYALHFAAPEEAPEIGSVRQQLARYRDVAI